MIEAILVAVSLLALLGVRYPLKMLPVLIFELVWKTLWVAVAARRMMMGDGLDTYASEVLFACVLGIVLTSIVLPWGYVFRTYLKDPSEPWRTAKN